MASAGARAGDRRKHHAPFGKNFYQNTPGADDQEGTERGVTDQAQGQLGAGRGRLAHHDARAEAGGQVVVGGPGRLGPGQAQPHSPDVGLVRDPGLVGLEHDRVADLGRGGQGPGPGAGGPGADGRDAVVAQQVEQDGAAGRARGQDRGPALAPGSGRGGGRRFGAFGVVQQVAHCEQAAAGALEDRHARGAQPGGGQRVDGRGQAGQHGDRLGRARGCREDGPGVGLVAVELPHQVDGQRDRRHLRVGGQRGQALGEQRFGVPAGRPHVERVAGLQAGVDGLGEPLRCGRAYRGERHAELGGQVRDVRAFQARVVNRRDAGFAAAPAPGPVLANREQLQGVGQLGQVTDPVQAVRAGQRLPRAVAGGQRARVRRDEVLAGPGQAHAEQDDRDVGGEGRFEGRSQLGGIPDRLQDQAQHLRLVEL